MESFINDVSNIFTSYDPSPPFSGTKGRHTFLDPTKGAYMTLIFVLKMNIGLDFSLMPLVKLGKSLWSNWGSDLILICGGYNKNLILSFFQPGFPNLFFLLGPGTGLGHNSVI